MILHNLSPQVSSGQGAVTTCPTAWLSPKHLWMNQNVPKGCRRGDHSWTSITTRLVERLAVALLEHIFSNQLCSKLSEPRCYLVARPRFPPLLSTAIVVKDASSVQGVRQFTAKCRTDQRILIWHKSDSVPWKAFEGGLHVFRFIKITFNPCISTLQDGISRVDQEFTKITCMGSPEIAALPLYCLLVVETYLTGSLWDVCRT